MNRPLAFAVMAAVLVAIVYFAGFRNAPVTVTQTGECVVLLKEITKYLNDNDPAGAAPLQEAYKAKCPS